MVPWYGTLRYDDGAAVCCVWLQGAVYPEPEQGRRRAEASTADDGHGRHVEELRHDGGHRCAGILEVLLTLLYSILVVTYDAKATWYLVYTSKIL